MENRRFKVLPEMEGAMARWYARTRGSGYQLEQYRKDAVRLTDGLPDGAAILEVAPGPGYQAVEIARLGRFTVTGLDVSRSMVEIATEYAATAGVPVEFRHGDVANLPFPAGSFDLVLCQAAFKNFTRPVTALDELHRVLRPGGTAVIQDLNHEASTVDIRREVAGMRLTPVNAWMTRSILRMLRRRAYSADRFRHIAADSAFGGCAAYTDGIGLEIRLTKRTTR